MTWLIMKRVVDSMLQFRPRPISEIMHEKNVLQKNSVTRAYSILITVSYIA